MVGTLPLQPHLQAPTILMGILIAPKHDHHQVDKHQHDTLSSFQFFEWR